MDSLLIDPVMAVRLHEVFVPTMLQTVAAA